MQQTETILRQGSGYNPMDIWDLDSEIKDFEENHKKNKLVTKEILSGWEKSRNSDFLLFWEYLRTKYPEIKVTSSPESIIFKIPRRIIPELINECPDCPGRIRRSLIQKAMKELNFEELNELLPTKSYILERRLKQDKIMRNFFSKYSSQLKIKTYSGIGLK